MEPVYWNEAIENMRPAALRQVENEALRTQLEYVCSASSFYQTKFTQAGISATPAYMLPLAEAAQTDS